jgi:hypothetical protein
MKDAVAPIAKPAIAMVAALAVETDVEASIYRDFTTTDGFTAGFTALRWKLGYFIFNYSASVSIFWFEYLSSLSKFKLC